MHLLYRWQGPRYLSCYLFSPGVHVSRRLDWKSSQILNLGALIRDVYIVSCVLTTVLITHSHKIQMSVRIYLNDRVTETHRYTRTLGEWEGEREKEFFHL